MDAPTPSGQNAAEKIVAMNEALLIGAIRQHELAEAAEKLNQQLQVEIGRRELLARELAEKARLLDISNDAIVVRGIDDRIISWNMGAERLFGWTAEEAVGMDLHSLLQTEFPKPKEEIVAQIQHDLHFEGEVAQVARDGRRVPSLCRWVFDVETASILTSYTDITERKIAEEALEEAKALAEAASQSKDHFLAVLSHELRTPLTPVLMAVSEMERDPALSAETRETVAMIKRNIRVETKLIDDLLDISGITTGKLRLNLESVDIHQAVRHACEICGEQLRGKGVHIEQIFSDQIGFLTADPARLQQVIWNLLNNAVKFTPEGGTIRVSTRRLSADRCELRVQDSGAGIAPEALNQIFGAFEQSDARVARKYGGLGLGLAISRSLVEFHGGTIRAESAGAGQGASFIVELPGREAHPAPVVPMPNAPASSPEPQTLCVLLVEDHVDTARALARLLTRNGYTVITAHDLASAKIAAETERYDLLVSDLGLPDGSGYDVLRAVRGRRTVPAIAMSGYGMEEDFRRSKDAGFSEHLVKPIVFEDLLAAIRRGSAPHG